MTVEDEVPSGYFRCVCGCKGLIKIKEPQGVLPVIDEILDELKKLNKTISGHLSHKKEIPQPYFFWLEAGIMGLLLVWFAVDVGDFIK
jgi:hypothetical protein